MSDKQRPYQQDIQAEVESACRERREVKLTPEQLTALGHVKKPPMKIIRAFCMDCMGGSQHEIRHCTSVGCSLWPYRFAKNPFRKQSEGSNTPRGFLKKGDNDE